MSLKYTLNTPTITILAKFHAVICKKLVIAGTQPVSFLVRLIAKPKSMIAAAIYEHMILWGWCWIIMQMKK